MASIITYEGATGENDVLHVRLDGRRVGKIVRAKGASIYKTESGQLHSGFQYKTNRGGVRGQVFKTIGEVQTSIEGDA